MKTCPYETSIQHGERCCCADCTDKEDMCWCPEGCIPDSGNYQGIGFGGVGFVCYVPPKEAE